MTATLVGTLIYVVGAALAVMVPGNRRRAGVALASQLLGTLAVMRDVVGVVAGGAELRAHFAWSYPIQDVPVHLDGLGAVFLAFSLPMTLLGSLYALGYLQPYFKRERHVGLHFALLNLVSVSFVMVYTLENAIAFLFGWELAALAAWLLVIWDYHNQRIRFAGFNYLVSTHIGLLLLVAAFMILHSRSGAFDFSAFSVALHEPGILRDVTFILLVTSFGLKSAFFPFHTWLPRAHSAAPAHVSALMSGVIHKAGLYALLRFTLLMGEPEPWMAWYLIVFSLGSAFGGVISTAVQRDLKRLLGYSSTENVGIAGLGFGVGYLGLIHHRPTMVALGFAGGLLHVVNHALFKCLLFYGAGAVYRSTHTVDLERLGGLHRKMPWTSRLFLVGALAICAVPPLNGFASEFLIYSAMLQGDGHPGVLGLLLLFPVAVLSVVGAISALSMTRAYGITFLGLPRDASVRSHGEARPSMLIPMALHALGVIVVGVVPALGLALVAAPVRLLLGSLGGPA
ncbi:MAG: proton-conducting transporter membrane subunit, partial [Myxococcota bacterium]